MGYIYKITNDINNKVYIGKTLTSIEERFQQHIKDSKRANREKRPLYNAMNKYGVEHFKIELIDEYPDGELSNMEIYWIAYYKGYEDGYNATRGGDGKQIYDHNLIRDRLLENPNRIEIANEFGCSVDLVSIIAKQNNITFKLTGGKNFLDKKLFISCFDLKTNILVKRFDSLTEAAKWLVATGACKTYASGIKTHLGEAAKGKRKSAYGYAWKYD